MRHPFVSIQILENNKEGIIYENLKSQTKKIGDQLLGQDWKNKKARKDGQEDNYNKEGITYMPTSS